MKRGELWVARADLYAAKVRPILIVQSDKIESYNSIITCLLTSFEREDDRFRLEIKPTKTNGLKKTSYLMFDKMFSFDKDDMSKKIGTLTKEQMAEVDGRLRIILDL
jgi:mRNA interferase MazF